VGSARRKVLPTAHDMTQDGAMAEALEEVYRAALAEDRAERRMRAAIREARAAGASWDAIARQDPARLNRETLRRRYG